MPKHLLPQITNRFSTYYYDLVVVFVVDVDVRKDYIYAGHRFSEQQQQQKVQGKFYVYGMQ